MFIINGLLVMAYNKKEWLKNLKVGDEVIIYCRWNYCYYHKEIVKITPKKIIVLYNRIIGKGDNLANFSREDGHALGRSGDQFVSIHPSN